VEAILEEIRHLKEKGADLRHGAIYPANKRLVSAAVRHFGSWRSAIASAGIDYLEIREQAEKSRKDKIRKWSKELIVKAIRDMAEAGESLAASSARRAQPGVMEAGIDYEAVLEQSKSNRHRIDSRRRRSILNKIRTLDQDVLLLPPERVAARYPHLFRLATEHFESWQHAVEQAPLPPQRIR